MAKLQAVVAVADAGSFTGAAKALGVGKSMVSAHLQRLEAELGVALLHRTSRKQLLTPAGARFVEGARQVLVALEQTVGAVTEASDTVRGRVRLTAPLDYASEVLPEVVHTLGERHPHLVLELSASDGVRDLVAEGLDLAVRLGPLRDSSLRAVRLGGFERVAVAAPKSPATKARSPEALERERFLALGVLEKATTLSFTGLRGAERTIHPAAAVVASSTIVLRALAEAGTGWAVLPGFTVAQALRERRLVRLLDGWRLGEAPMHAVSPPGPHRPRRVTVVLEALRAHHADRATRRARFWS